MAKTIHEINAVIDKGPYAATWASLQTATLPAWFQQEKFGIFIHWGLYSIPAFNNEWYSRNMYIEGSVEFKHHVKTYGQHKTFGYQHFIPMFTADKFDPSVWAEVILRSGAKYVFPVAEHHDGFQMYRSDISHWNSYEMGPKRDILGELRKAFEERGLRFCTSSHRAEHWFFMSHGRLFNSDIDKTLNKGDFYWPSEKEQNAYNFSSKPAPSKAYLEDWLMRTVEIVDVYHPSIMYFDWWIQHEAFKPYLKKFAAYYFNEALRLGQEVAISYKHDALLFGSGIIEIERGRFSTLKHFPWQTETAIANNSWCYTETLDYKSPIDIITLLIDVVSKNGNLLLNIGPKGDGSIPAYEVALLESVGDWLAINGEAIYGSKPYKVYGEGPTKETEGKFSEQTTTYTAQDFRFTVNHGAFYAICLNPANETFFRVETLRKATEHQEGLFSNIERVTCLGCDEDITFEHRTDGLVIKTDCIKSYMPVIFKIETE